MITILTELVLLFIRLTENESTPLIFIVCIYYFGEKYVIRSAFSFHTQCY